MGPLRRACVVGATGGLVLGVLLVSWQVAMAQAVPPAPVANSAETEIMMRLLAYGGLPGALMAIAWWVPHAARSLWKGAMADLAELLQTWEPVVTIKLDDESADKWLKMSERLEALERQNTAG